MKQQAFIDDQAVANDFLHDQQYQIQLKQRPSGGIGIPAPIRTRSENRTGLPDDLKAGVESLSGISLDHVKVHYNSSAPAQLNALAYAQGSEIFVAPGQEQHLPHETWHVVQQAQGRVQPTFQLREGVPVNDDAGLEREADEMGVKSLETYDTFRQQSKEDNSLQIMNLSPHIAIGQDPPFDKAKPSLYTNSHPNNLLVTPTVQESCSLYNEDANSRFLSGCIQNKHFVRINELTPVVQAGQAIVQMLLVRVRTNQSNRVIRELKIEGRAPTVVAGGQGDHTIAEAHLMFMLERTLIGKTHDELPDKLCKMLALIDFFITAKYFSSKGRYETLSMRTLDVMISDYKQLVIYNADLSAINEALEDIIDAFIRLWNKRDNSAYAKHQGMTTGGGQGAGEKEAKKHLHSLSNHSDKDQYAEDVQLAMLIGERIAEMVDFVPRTQGDYLKDDHLEAASLLASSFEMAEFAIPNIEINYEVASTSMVENYGERLGLSYAQIELLDLYVSSKLRGKEDYFAEYEAELLKELASALNPADNNAANNTNNEDYNNSENYNASGKRKHA